jgi:preprotein translocase subunit SecF
MRILTDVNIDWLRWRWHSLALSWLIILSGLGLILTRGLPLGIDFTGGTALVVQFETDVPLQQVRAAVDPLPGDEVVQQFDDPSKRQVLIRLAQVETAEQGTSLEEGSRQVAMVLQSAGLPKFEIISRDLVGAVIGEDLQRKGIYATIASLLGIMAYISFRFRFSFGIGAMVASIHDVLITLSLLTFFGYELSLNVIAAILTLVGYGVNDQIVIFDRVRENLKTHRNEPMNVVINKSVNQTLPRTVITAGATALAVLSLYLFGGVVLEPFAFAMLVGIITSTYSTVFIASAVAVLLSPRPRTATAGAAPARGAAGKPGGKSPRRAKAS